MQPSRGENERSGGQPGGQASPWQQPTGEQQAWQPVSGESSSWQQPTGEQPAWQPPAYTSAEYPPYQQPGQFYPPYQQPGQPYAPPGGYPQPGTFGPQPGQYTQPGTQPGPYEYAQPGQFRPGQYGQPGGYPQQTIGYGPPDQRAKRSRAVIGAVAGGFALIVSAVVLILGFWQPGFFMTTKLDISKAQAGVQQILTDETNGYGAKNVKDVKCNNGQDPIVKKGNTFDCDVSIDGTRRQVTVTFQDDKGTYEVGRPK